MHALNLALLPAEPVVNEALLNEKNGKKIEP